MTEKRTFRRAVDARLSGLTVSHAQQMALLRRARAPHRGARRAFSASLIFALALLLSTTACAGMYFGVIDFNIEQKDNPTFIEHIRSINKQYESDYLAVDVHQALFDGVSLSLALDVQRKATAQGLYVYPRIAAETGGQTLSVQIDSFTSDTQSCGFSGAASMLLSADGSFGLTASLAAHGDENRRYDVARSPVSWTVILDLVSPRKPLDADMEAGGVIFLSDPPDAEAFTFVDSLSFPLATAETHAKTLSCPQVLDLGNGYELTVHSLVITFDRADYEFEVCRREGYEPSAAQTYGAQTGQWIFGVLSAQGIVDYRGGSCGTRGDGVYYSYSLALTAPTDELTFVPIWYVPTEQEEAPGMTLEEEIFLSQHEYSPEQMEKAFTLKAE